ncbi:MAG: (deoxy)nucleoside triphosphate pyrophosphohydrolase [Spirochaetia bacterium]
MPVSTAALIARNGAFLFVRRPTGGDLSECWELPGGKVEPGELPEEALRRELTEELGIEARIGDLAARSRFEHRGMSFELLAFRTTADLGTMKLREHTEFCWRTPSAALALELAPSDRTLMRRLMGDGSG